MELNNEMLEKARLWMYRNARPITLARWKYHFEQGSSEDVIDILKTYQNEDGGFGHGLEADSWNPNSSPIETNRAIEILREMGEEEKHPEVIQGILKYLESGKNFKNKRWQITVPENNSHPHAPWWTHYEDTDGYSDYNPTASLIEFILHFGDSESELYLLALNILEELKEDFIKNRSLTMHEVICLTSLEEYLDDEHLHKAIDGVIEKDHLKWGGYYARPSTFVRSKENPLYEPYAPLIAKEVIYLLNTRNEEGVWEINWEWNSYLKEFAISENWWKGEIAIQNLLFLKNFNAIE